MAKFDKSVLASYGIQTGTAEVLYNPSYEVLFNEETKAGLEGFDKCVETELGAVNCMTGIYTGRSPKDKFIVVDELKLDEIKTKKFVEVMNNLKVEKALVVLDDMNENVIASAANVPTVKTAQTNELNVFDALKYDTVVVTKAAVATIEEVYA